MEEDYFDSHDDKECNNIINLIGKRNLFKHNNVRSSARSIPNDTNDEYYYDDLFDDKDCNELINLIGKRNLFKLKYDASVNNTPLTVMRTIRNRINTKYNKILNDVLSIQFRASKCVANQAIYANRQWYSIHHIFVNYIYDNISTDLVKRLSTRDKLILFELAIKKHDLFVIGMLFSHIRLWEKDKFDDHIKKLANFSDEDKIAIIKEGYPLPIGFINSPRVIYKDDPKHFANIIDSIDPINFKNKFVSLKNFIELMKDCFIHKANNLEKNKDNEKSKRGKKGTKRSDIKKIVKKNTMVNYIPPRYLETDFIEIYVRKQFELNFKDEQKKTSDGATINIVTNPSLLLGSQVVQQTINKVDKMYDSFFKKLKKNPLKHHTERKKINPPYYLEDKYVLIFQSKSFSILEELDKNYKTIRYARLSLGTAMKNIINRKYPDTKGFIKFKIPDHIKEKIVEIELVPGRNENDAYINFKYNKEVPKPAPIIRNDNNEKDEDIFVEAKKENTVEKNYIEDGEMKNVDFVDMAKKVMSIDTGTVYIATCVCFGLDTPIIYSGTPINHINSTYLKLISEQQSILDTKEPNTYILPHIKNMYNNLWTRREQLIRNEFEKITNDMMKICTENGITEIIIGYNTNWKKGVNMGRKMNKKFCMIPYRQFIEMIHYKGINRGINVRELEESYTSKCDALNLEQICYHDKYSGIRGPRKINSKNKTTKLAKSNRGLFQSARGVLINADVNGAINIMRKGVAKRERLKDALEEIIRGIELKKVCNPQKKHFRTNE